MLRKSFFGKTCSEQSVCKDSKYAKRLLKLFADYSILFERSKHVVVDGKDVTFDVYVPEYNLYIDLDDDNVKDTCNSVHAFTLSKGNEERAIKLTA